MRILTKSTRFGYGIGGIVHGVKDAAFVTFLLFYYTQVLGLKGSIAGMALMIGLCMDAITDPVMGSISDNFSSKYGRRHLFMLIAAIPMAVSLFALFTPPKGLDQIGLFVWLTVFVVLVRTSLTIFWVPYLAFGAEVSTDYIERTKLSTHRTTMSWFGLVGVATFSFVTFFRKTPQYQVGQMNPTAYPYFGAFCAVMILLAIASCYLLTRKEIPYLPQAPDNPQAFKVKRLVDELKLAFKNPSFRVIALTAIFSGMLIGIHTNLNMHVNTYFWEFTSKKLAILTIPILISTVLAFILMRVLERFDKRKAFMTVCLCSIFHNLLTILRLFGVAPENGDPLLLKLAFIQLIYTYTLAIAQMILVGSIIADTVDEGELITNVRQEGIYFSFFSFTSKAVSGFGSLFAGLIIDFIGLPAKAVPGTVDPAVVRQLGIIVGPVVSVLWIIPITIISTLKMSKERQLEIKDEIERRKEQRKVYLDTVETT